MTAGGFKFIQDILSGVGQIADIGIGLKPGRLESIHILHDFRKGVDGLIPVFHRQHDLGLFSPAHRCFQALEEQLLCFECAFLIVYIAARQKNRADSKIKGEFNSLFQKIQPDLANGLIQTSKREAAVCTE